MNRLNRSSVNMLASLIGYAVPMIISLVTTPIVLKELGVTAYGLTSLIGVIIGYLTVMDMGLDLPITKYLAEDNAKVDTEAANRMLNTTLQLYIIIGVVGMFSIFFTAKWLAGVVFKVPDDMLHEGVAVFRLAGIGFLGSVCMSWGRAVAMGIQRFEITYGVSVITNLAGVCLGLLMIYTGYGVVGFVLMRVLSNLLAGIAYWMYARRLLPFYHFRFGFDRATILRVRGYIGYGALNRVMGGIVSGLDKTLIGIWLGVAMAGIYSIPVTLVSSLGYMLAYMLGFIFPIASELHSLGQMEKLRDIFTRSTRFLTALASLVFIPVLVFGDMFITKWVGTDIGDKTRYVLLFMALSGYLGTLTVTLPNNIAVGTGRIKQFTLYSAIRSIVLGAGCFILIRPMGIEGAGLALLLANIVDVFFLLIVLKYYLHISAFKLILSAYMKPLAIGFSLAVFTIFLRPFAHSWIGLIISIGLFEVLYILLSYWFKVFGETEKLVILNFVRKLKP